MSLTVTDNLEGTYLQDMLNPWNDRQLGQHSQVRSDKTVDRMSKLKREMDYLERGMQRVRMKLAKLQQDPTQTQVTSRIGIGLKKIIDQQDYHINAEQDRNQDIYNTNMYSGPYPTIEQQIQIDAMLSRLFHKEEKAKHRERISQLVNKNQQNILIRKDLIHCQNKL